MSEIVEDDDGPRNYTNRDGILYFKDRIYVPESMVVNVLKDIHDQLSSAYPGIRRTMELVKRHYYIPRLRSIVERYLRNYQIYKRIKAPRDKKNKLLYPLLIPDQRWKDLLMDLITTLPKSKGCNVIFIIYCRLLKERLYIPVTNKNEGISAKELTNVFLKKVYRYYGLFSLIVSDRGP